MRLTQGMWTVFPLSAVIKMIPAFLNRKLNDSVVKLAAWLCARFGLTSEQVIRHYDVTGKECPKYYVDHPDAWEQMKADINAQITIDQGLMGIS